MKPYAETKPALVRTLIQIERANGNDPRALALLDELHVLYCLHERRLADGHCATCGGP